MIKVSLKKIIQSVNITMVYTYFEIGRMIVEHLQRGKDRADYGKQVLKSLSEQLTQEFGKGFSECNLLHMKNFYQGYSISQTPSAEFKSINSSTLSGISETEKGVKSALDSFKEKGDNEKGVKSALDSY
ncbi:MAG: DUF1016 N-terminal domain-containing protein [Thermodesulfobacteriota bacterium]|nr:DUF1016 N-terminal domain-containing protein [Thermodesulfobacteriota bacterium]